MRSVRATGSAQCGQTTDPSGRTEQTGSSLTTSWCPHDQDCTHPPANTSAVDRGSAAATPPSRPRWTVFESTQEAADGGVPLQQVAGNGAALDLVGALVDCLL